MARLTSRVAAIIGAVIVLAVIAIGWFALVSPQRSKASSLGTQISEAQTRLELALAQERTLRREARSRSSEIAALDRALPKDVLMSDILRELSSASAATGVQINGITPTATTAPGVGYNTVTMSVGVQGSYFGLVNFLHNLHARAEVKGSKLHASGRLFRVDQIAFTGGAAGSGSSQSIQANLTIDAFTAADIAPTPTTTAPTASSAPASPATASPAGP